MRRQVSLLLDHGHKHAHSYPIGMVSDEASLVAERLNRLEATRAILVQMAISSVLTKEGGKVFQKTVKELTE